MGNKLSVTKIGLSKIGWIKKVLPRPEINLSKLKKHGCKTNTIIQCPSRSFFFLRENIYNLKYQRHNKYIYIYIYMGWEDKSNMGYLIWGKKPLIDDTFSLI